MIHYFLSLFPIYMICYICHVCNVCNVYSDLLSGVCPPFYVVLSNFLLWHFMLGICTYKLTYLQSNNFACYWYFSHSRVQLWTTINRFSETINKFYARLGNRNQGDDSEHANIIISRSIGAGFRAWTWWFSCLRILCCVSVLTFISFRYFLMRSLNIPTGGAWWITEAITEPISNVSTKVRHCCNQRSCISFRPC